MATTPEGKVKKAVKSVFVENGVWYYMPVQNGMGTVGIPDLVACAPITITEDMVGKKIGVFVAVETKAPGKEKNTTPNQKNVLHGISEAGGVAIVTDNTARVEEALNELKQGNVNTYVP